MSKIIELILFAFIPLNLHHLTQNIKPIKKTSIWTKLCKQLSVIVVIEAKESCMGYLLRNLKDGVSSPDPQGVLFSPLQSCTWSVLTDT